MISVVLPVRDAAPFLQVAIDSILGQTHDDLELIVVDDGSQDGSTEIAEAAAVEDPRVRVLRGSAEGISTALNAGVAVARGDWVARMDADDIAQPHRLARQLAAAEQRPEVVLWGSWVELFVDGGRRTMVAEVGPTTLREFVRGRDHGPPVAFVHPTIMVRRDVIERAGGYDSRFDGAEDIELFDRIGQLGPMLAIPEPLLRYRMRPGSETLRRYAVGRDVTRYVNARIAARRAGTEAPSWETSRAELAGGPLRRLRWGLRDRGEWAAAHADMAYMAGDTLRAGALKATAALVDPVVLRRVVRRLRGRAAVRTTGPGGGT